MKLLQRRIQQADIFEPALLDEVRASWERTLGPFVPELPDVEKVFAETRDRRDAVLKLQPTV